MKNKLLFTWFLISALNACQPALADPTPKKKNALKTQTTAKYHECINTVKQVASKDDDIVGMIIRCRELAINSTK